jgi:hypothetical protein
MLTHGGSAKVKSLIQGYDGCSPTPSFGGSISIGSYKRRSREDCAYRFALHSDTSSVDDPQGFVAQAMGFRQVFLDNGFQISWRNSMEIKHICYWKNKWFIEWVL